MPTDRATTERGDPPTGFYHLTRSTPERALARLLGRTLDSGERAVVRTVDRDAAERLDAALWAEPDPDWLPHGADPADAPHAKRQPVWITDGDALGGGAPNGAGFLFLLGGADSAHRARFSRVFDLFDGGDAGAVAAARERWRAVRERGGAPSYWRETPGGWEQGR